MNAAPTTPPSPMTPNAAVIGSSALLEHKPCASCRQAKPLGEYHLRKASKDGLARCCKQCVKDYDLQHRTEHHERIRAAERDYYHAHKNELKVKRAPYFKSYAAAHKPEAAARMRKARKRNPRKFIRRTLEYQQRNPEKVKVWRRKTAANNRARLNPCYVKNLLADDGLLRARDIPDSLVELYTEIIKLKRICKKQKTSKNSASKCSNMSPSQPATRDESTNAMP